jgi:prepilin-type N-terminal cleavage/methylation domain-containing protein
MALNKNDKGLTLIELLITIAVIAIVEAISVPVITNVIGDSRTNSASAMQEQVNSFIEKYTESGEVSYNGTDEFTAWVDLDGDGVFSSPSEVIETFTVDTTQFAVTITGTNQAPTSVQIDAAGSANNAGGNEPEAPAVPAFDATGYTAVNFFTNIGGNVLNNYIGMSSDSSVTNFDSTISTTWSPTTPVLVINEAGLKYGFIKLDVAKYGIDYYDNAGNNNPTVVDNVYYVAVGDSPNMTVGSRSIIIHYESSPIAGPANKLSIAWQGFATDAPSGK